MQPARVWTHTTFDAQALAAFDPQTTVIAGSARDPEWYDVAATCDALILDGLTVIDAPTIKRIGPRLRVVARTGIGIDRINVDDATAAGVMVINTPDGPTESTAEHAIALMLSLTKRVADGDRILRSGTGWRLPSQGFETVGATLGLVGLGRIGGRVAEIARALGMRVLAFDPFVSPERAAALSVALAGSLDELLSSSDVVSLHCPAIPETYRLIGAAALAKMRPGSYLINVARGTVIDEDALVAALRSGHLAGAGLDVYDPEPARVDHPLFSLPNTVCTPHIASYTAASVLRMQVMACEQVAQALRGEHPSELVNRAVWERRRQPAQ
jgi:D-3-phosphoglycerate dehydrogenase